MKHALLIAAILVVPIIAAQGTGTIRNSAPEVATISFEATPTHDIMIWTAFDRNGVKDIIEVRLSLNQAAPLLFAIPHPVGQREPDAEGWSAWDPTPGDGSIHIKFNRAVPPADATTTWNFGARDEGGWVNGDARTETRTNAIPVVSDDHYIVIMGQVLRTPSHEGVLANDVDEHILQATVASPPAAGSLALQADGSFTYDPATPGEFQFTYQASDGAATVEGNAALSVYEDNAATSVPVRPDTTAIRTGGNVLRVSMPAATDTGNLRSVTFERSVDPYAPATIDFANVVQRSPEHTTIHVGLPLEIRRVESVGDVTVRLPAGLQMRSTADWDGEFLTPTFVPLQNAPAGAVLSFSLGRHDADIRFSMPVTILIPNQAGHDVQVDWTEGTSLLPDCAGGHASCISNLGTDLLIQTEHLSTFTILVRAPPPQLDSVSPDGSPSTSTQGAPNWLPWLILELMGATALVLLTMIIVARRRRREDE